jgi:hypothetical protein
MSGRSCWPSKATTSSPIASAACDGTFFSTGAPRPQQSPAPRRAR